MNALLLTLIVAVGPLEPYDNFNPSEPSPQTPQKIIGIDWNRWDTRAKGAGTNRVRRQAGMRLRLQQTSSATDGSYGLSFVAPSTVTAIEAKVRMLKGQLRTCSGQAAEVRAQLGGRFFNTGTANAASALNDVQAWARVSRSSSDVAPFAVHLEGVVERCDDATCTARTVLHRADLGLLEDEHEATLSVSWDPASKTFTFAHAGGTSRTYSFRGVGGAPGAPLKSLEVGQSLPACAGASASSNVYLHDVRVNPAAAPNI